MTLRKLTRGQLRTVALRLLKDQDGLCPVCQKVIDISIKGELVVDHCHETGRIRGVLHRSCNSGCGKVDHAAGRWGAKSMSYAAIIPWLENMLAYYKRPMTEYIYPTHKTDDERRLERNAKARRERATKKARVLVRGQKKTEDRP